jgi:uncharacterized protein YegL
MTGSFLKSISLILAGLLLFELSAQEVEPMVFDLGKLKEKNQDVVDLVIHNSLDQPIELIAYEADQGVQFQARRMIIPSNAYDFFRVKVGMNSLGEFSKGLWLKFDDERANQRIQFVGTVKKIPRNQLQDCPSFDNLPSAQKLAKQQQKLNSNIQMRFLSVGVPAESEGKLSNTAYRPNNLVFLLDVSSSMKRDGKLELLKASMETLLGALRTKDKISLLSYDTQVKVLIDQTFIENTDSLLKIIQGLEAQGATNAIEGIGQAIETAYNGQISGGNNQLYLVSDGAFALDEETKSRIKGSRKTDLNISILAIKSSRSSKRSLKKISRMSKGELIRINEDKDKEKILEDVKRRSKY